jgi:hypothetical protein
MGVWLENPAAAVLSPLLPLTAVDFSRPLTPQEGWLREPLPAARA